MVYPKAGIEEIATRIINSQQVEFRDVDGGQDPFVYSTGNRGPAYLMVKGLVGQPEIFLFLMKQLAYRVVDEAKFEFIEGNATGGMIPGWQLRNDVSELIGRQVPYTYLRGSRKEGGHAELITGIRSNPEIKQGDRALVVEELVNFAGTTTIAAETYRNAGYPVSHAACILTYDHAESNQRLANTDVELISLITLPALLTAGEAMGKLNQEAVATTRKFLASPLEWQLSRDYVIPADNAKTAIEQGYRMRELAATEAIQLGAPEGKVKEGVIYFAEDKAA